MLATEQLSRYPAKVITCAYGKGLIATKTVLANTKIQRFIGAIVTFEQIPPQEICYALLIADQQWLIPTTDARYINHSCEPNCIIDDNLFVITNQVVTAGTEFTFSYNTVTKGENDPGTWDQRWTFNCNCGAKNCQGLINRYLYLP